MLSQLPQKFYTCDPCGSGFPASPYPASTVACAGQAICDPRFYSLPTIAAGAIPIIAPGAGCMGVLSSAVAGIVVSLGNGLGFTVTDAPAFPLTEHNPAVGGVVSAGGAFPFVMVAAGASPVTPWKRLLAPSVGTFQILAVNGAFQLTDASQLGQLQTLFGVAGTSLTIEPLGFLQTGTDGGGAPIFSPRKLIGTVNNRPVPLVLELNANGRYDEKAHDLTAILPIDKLGIQTIQETDAAGAAVAGGFTTLPTGVSRNNLAPLLYDFVAMRLYKMPPRVCQMAENVSDVALVENDSWAHPAPHGDMTIADNNWPTLFVAILIRFDNEIRLDGARLKINGAVAKEFYYRKDEAGGGQSEYHFTCLLIGVANGALVLTFEYRESNDATSPATKIVASTISAFTVL